METHHSPGIADCLEAWGVPATDPAAEAARFLFSRLDEFHAFFDTVAPGTRAYEESRVSGDYDFAFILTAAREFIVKTTVTADAASLHRVAAFIHIARCFQCPAPGYPGMAELLRGYMHFTCDPDYALAVLPSEPFSNEMVLIFPVVSHLHRVGITSQYASQLGITRTTRFWNASLVNVLAASGVRAKYAAKLGAYFTSPHIIVLHENGVKARYAKELHAWLGDGDVTDICLLWREGVPLDYAVAGLQSRLSAEDILRHFDEGISVEYMAVAHV